MMMLRVNGGWVIKRRKRRKRGGDFLLPIGMLGTSGPCESAAAPAAAQLPPANEGEE